MSHLLCLDLATKTGWALFDPATCMITSGVISFKPSRFEGGGMRFLRFAHWLDEMLLSGIQEVAFEEVRRHMGTDAAHIHGGLLAHLTAWCEKHSIPYQGHGVQAIKKHVTGKGNADKSAVIQAILMKGHEPADDNEADALALLYLVIDNAATRPSHIRPAPNRGRIRRVPLEPLPVAAPAVRSRRR